VPPRSLNQDDLAGPQGLADIQDAFRLETIQGQFVGVEIFPLIGALALHKAGIPLSVKTDLHGLRLGAALRLVNLAHVIAKELITGQDRVITAIRAKDTDDIDRLVRLVVFAP